MTGFRLGTNLAVLIAGAVVKNSGDLGSRLRSGSPALIGQSAGFVMRWALVLVDDGAEPKDVRELIALGMRGAS